MDAVNNSGKQRGRPFRPGETGNRRGRPPGSLNKRTRALIEAVEAGGETPLQYMLRVMRDSNADTKRRDAMATAAAPYVHSKLSAVDTPRAGTKEKPRVSVEVSFVDPPPCFDYEEESRP